MVISQYRHYIVIKSRWTASAKLAANAPRFTNTDKYLRLVIVYFASNLIISIRLCCTWQSRAPNIDHCAPNNWPLTLKTNKQTTRQTNRLCRKITRKVRINRRKTWFITVWPWTLTYDLDLQSQPSQGQGRLSHQKSRSKVKRFKQESSDKQTNKQANKHKRTLPSALSPCFAVDNHRESLPT